MERSFRTVAFFGLSAFSMDQLQGQFSRGVLGNRLILLVNNGNENQVFTTVYYSNNLSAILNHFHLSRAHCLFRLFFERFDFRINDRPLPILYGYSMPLVSNLQDWNMPLNSFHVT